MTKESSILKNTANIYTKIQTHVMDYAVDEKMPETFSIELLTEKANIIKEHLKNI